MNPESRDPRLNTAECVIQGHKPNIDAPGVSPYIKPILWCSFLSVMLLGPIIAFMAFYLLKDLDSKGENERSKVDYNGKGPLNRSADLLCHFLLLIELIIVLSICFSNILEFKNIPLEIYIPVACIILEGIILCVVQLCSKCNFCAKANEVSFYRRCIFITCINVLSYHLCWLIVGIMLNPAWGLTVLFIVCFVGVASIFSLQQIFDAKSDFIQPCLTLAAIFVSLCLVVVMTVLAGLSFSGRETADDVMKAALLYVVGVILWLFKESPSTSSQQINSNSNQNESDLTQGNQGTTPDLTQPTLDMIVYV